MLGLLLGACVGLVGCSSASSESGDGDQSTGALTNQNDGTGGYSICGAKPIPVGNPARKPIFDAVRPIAAKEVKMQAGQLVFRPSALRMRDGYAFVDAEIRVKKGSDDRALDENERQTAFPDGICDGPRLIALLQGNGTTWKVVNSVVNTCDPTYMTWSAPQGIVTCSDDGEQ
jgi:hypothetical protein